MPTQSLPGDTPVRTAGLGGSLALLVVLFGSFMDLLDGTIVILAAPAIVADLGATDAQIQWTVAAYTLALSAGLIVGGRLGDTYGRRRLFLLGLAAFTVASASCALAPTVEVLIATRTVQGLAAGAMVPQVFGIIRGSFTPARRAQAFGAYGAVQGLAAIAGPLLGGVLVSMDAFGLGWRSIFWINVPVCLVAFALGLRVLPESRSSRTTGSFDLLGAALGALGVFLLLLPLIQITEWGWTGWSSALVLLALLTLATFLGYERHLGRRRGREPVFDPTLLRIRPFSAGLVASLLFFSGIGSLFLMLSVYLQAGAGRSALQTGLVILPYALGSILTSGLGVALAARAGRALLISGSLLIAAANLGLYLVVADGTDPGYWPLATMLFISGLGLGLAVPILVNVVLAGVPGRDAGAAGGVLSTVTQVGGVLGIAALATTFFALANGSAQGGPVALVHYGPAFGVVLVISAALYVAAAGVMLLLPAAAQGSEP